MKYKLSIIVPVYNSALFLKNNMLTIIKQLNDEVELILVNDGSTDNSLDICEMLKKSHNNISVYDICNSGVSVARNTGIQFSTGEYLTFVDSDDYVSSNYINTILASLGNNADLVIFNNYVVGTKKKVEKYFLVNGNNWDNLKRVYTLSLNYMLNAPWDKVFKRSIIIDNNITFIEKQNMGEDIIFCLEYLKHVSNVYTISKCIYYHTINENGLCHRKINIEQFAEHNLIFEKMQNFASNYARTHQEDVYKVILRNMFNFAGKLSTEGYSKNEIHGMFEQSAWYSKVINLKYEKMFDKIRKIIFKRRWYALMGLLAKRG